MREAELGFAMWVEVYLTNFPVHNFTVFIYMETKEYTYIYNIWDEARGMIIKVA